MRKENTQYTLPSNIVVLLRDLVLPIKNHGHRLSFVSIKNKVNVSKFDFFSCPAGKLDKARPRSTNALALSVQLQTMLNATTHYAFRTPGAMQ
jgi:hypothetical protein